jgi:hypothetical protein
MTTADICVQLRKTHAVDEFFYPNISMDQEMPNGFEGEVSQVKNALSDAGFEASVTSIWRVMELKRTLLLKYNESEKGRRVLALYRKLLTTKVKPVGSAVPVDLLFVNGLVLILLYIVARFGTSFADEAGKIAARKLLGTDAKEARRHKMNEDEYRLIRTEASLWIEE